MRYILKAVVVVMLGGGVFSCLVLAVRALNEGPSADLLGPAIAAAAFLLPAVFLSIPLSDPPFYALPPPPTPPPPWLDSKLK